MAASGGVGVRLFVEGDEVVRKAFGDIADSGKKMWAEIAQGEKHAAPGLRGVNAVAQEVKGGVHELAAEAGAGGRILSAFGVAGIGAAAALGGFAIALKKGRESLDWIAELEDSAKRLHVSVEALQEWRFAAQDAGASATDFDSAMGAFAASIGKLTDGQPDEKIEKIFAALKIKPEDIRQFGSLDQALAFVGDRLNEVQSDAERVRIAEAIGIGPLLPLLEQGSTKIERLREEARQLGLVVSDETAASMGELHREVEVAAQVIDVNLKQAFLAVAPVLAGLITQVAQFITHLRTFMSMFQAIENRSQAVLERNIAATEKRLADFDKNPAARMAHNALMQGLGLPSETTEGHRARLAAMKQQWNTNELAIGDEDWTSGLAGGGAGGPPPKGAAAKKAAAAGRAPEDRTDQALAEARRAELQAQEAILRERLSQAGEIEQQSDLIGQIGAIEREQIHLDRQKKDEAIDQLLKNKNISAATAATLKADNARVEALQLELRDLQDAKDIRDRDLKAQEGAMREREKIQQLMSQSAQIEAQLVHTQSERRSILLRDLQQRQRNERQAEIDAADAAIARGDLSASGKSARLAELDRRQGLEARQTLVETMGPLEQYLDGLNMSAAELGETLERVGVESFKSLTDALVQAAASGENLGEVLKSMLLRLILQATSFQLQKSGAGLLSSLIHTATSAFGGGPTIPLTPFTPIVVTPHALGTGYAMGGLSIVGERGFELMDVPAGARILPQEDSLALLRQAANPVRGGLELGGVHINVDARGAGPREVDEIRAEMRRLESSLPGRIVSTVNEGIERNLIR